MVRIALTEFAKYDAAILPFIDQNSFAGAVIQCAQLGLTPGAAMGQIYMLPFRNGKRSIAAKRDVYDITLITGYKGKIKLVHNSGAVKSIAAYEIKQNDVFEYRFSLDTPPTHIPPKLNEPRGETIGVWAEAKMTDGGHQWVVLDLDAIKAARAQSKSRNSGPWVDFFDDMARKTAVHRLCKMLPMKAESEALLQEAHLEELTGAGVSQNHQLLVDNTFEADWSSTEDAATMAAAQAADNDNARRAEFKTRLLDAITAAKLRLKLTDADVSQRLGVSAPSDLDAWPLDKIDATIDAVADWQG